MEPLYQTSLRGSSLIIWPTHIEYKAGFLSTQTTVLIKDVASIDQVINLFAMIGGMRELNIETSIFV